MKLIQKGCGVGVVLAVMAVCQSEQGWAEMTGISSSQSVEASVLAGSSVGERGAGHAPASKLTWFDTLESGWKAARDTGRPMVIFITSDHCQYCDVMKQNTLTDPSVRDRLLRRFIPIRLRPDSNAQVLSRVEVTAFPTTLVAHPRGKVLAHRIGYQPVDQFHQLLSEAGPIETAATVGLPTASPAHATSTAATFVPKSVGEIR